MRNTYFLPIWLLMCLISGVPLIAQNNSCGPEEVIDTSDFEGTAFFNYGSRSKSRSNTYKTTVAAGQNFTGFMEDAQHNTSLGFYSRFFLPPFALDVSATQGELLDRIQLTWEVDPLGPSASDGFNIYRNGIFLATVGANIRSYNDFNVIAGEPYTYTVRGLNIFGEGTPGTALGFQIPNGTVTGWIATLNGSPVPNASVTLTPMQGFSLRFEDSDGALAIADSLNPFLPAMDEDWTIAFWIKTDTAGSNSGKLIGMPGLVIRSRPSTNGNEGIAVATTPGGTAFLVANFPSNPNGWHHVALSYDKNGNKGRLYFDGVLMRVSPMNPVISPDEINFGERIAAGLWEGRIDELRIYHRQLDELDFDMVMEGTASSTTPYLTHYWKMDEELGEKSYDIVKRHQLYFCGAEFDPDRPPVHTAGITNEDGFYMIESASYGTGTTFLATPNKNFYMHRALNFEKSESDFATLPDFPLTPKATIEVWVNSAGPSGTQGILIKNLGNATFKVELEENGLDNDINVHLNGVTHTYGLLGSGYKHLAFTWDSTTNTIKGYKNGVLLNSFSYPAVTGQWSGHGAWVFGYSGNFANTFDGLIDEIAFYDTTLSVARIQSHFQNERDMQERGLRVYFPLDEGSGTKLSNVGSLLLDGGTSHGASWSALAALQVIEPHIFSPTTRQVTLNPSVTSVDQVDFTDRSTIAVSGYVRYQNTDCFAGNVEILINGESLSPQILTDSTGKFLIDVDPGATATLTPKYGDHVFVPASWDITNVSSPIAGILFNDITTHKITGRVAGGDCQVSITLAPTECRVKVSSLDGCYVDIAEIGPDGLYSFLNLPPLEKFSVAVIEHSDPAIETFFNTLGGSIVNISQQDTVLLFIYKAQPEIILNNIQDLYAPGCPIIVLDQFTDETIEIRLKEQYQGGACFIDSASFHIINGFGDVVVDTAMGGGTLWYEFEVGEPNPTPPYLKTLQIISTTLDENESDYVVQGVVTGSRAKDQLFTTTLPETPILILRDPPGDGSYAYLEKNEKVCQKITFSKEVIVEAGFTGVLDLGPDVDISLSFGPDIEFESQVGPSTTQTTTIANADESAIEVCNSFSERISTSDDDLIVGSNQGGDVYVGGGLNIEFGFVSIIEFDYDSCKVDESLNAMVVPGNYATTFMYSEWGIKNNVLVYLNNLLDISTDDSQDSIYEESIDRWNKMLTDNAAQKDSATFLRNISFDAGAVYEYSETSDTAITSSLASSTSIRVDFDFFALFYGLGVGGGIILTTNVEDIKGETQEGTTENGITTGYVLSDDDVLDAFTIDVGMDKVYKTPVFNTKAGQSSCPWEYPTAKREGVLLTPTNGAEKINIPSHEPAAFTFIMGNVSATNETWTYAFTAGPESNPHGAEIFCNGAPMNQIQWYAIPWGTSIPVTVTVERGPIEYDYDSLEIVLYSACEDQRANDLGILPDTAKNLYSAVYISAHFIRPCSEVDIHQPQQDWVLFPDPLTSGPDDEMRITVSGYDTSNTDFLLIRVQYRESNGDGAWLPIGEISERYNPNSEDTEAGDSLLTPTFTQFYWDTDGLKDGLYEIRAVTVCEGDSDDMPGQSDVIKGRIDREAPSLVGFPQPSDHVLHAGDEISFTFNQEIECHDFLQNPLNAKLYRTSNGSQVSEVAHCVGNKIVIVPTGQTSLLENETLRAVVYNVKDLTGNKLDSAVWLFHVDRNELNWLTDSVGITKYEDEIKSVTVKIHNRGGYPVPFTIEDVPDWIHVSPDAGTLVANEIRELEFTAEDTLDLGWFSDVITLRTVTDQNSFFMGGDEALPFAVRNICRPPDWEVNPALYQITMTMIMRLRINNVFSSDPEDQVGIFIGGQLRGTAKLTYVPSTNTWIAFVTVYGNSSDIGKPLVYEIFDASACLRYPGSFSGTPATFATNATHGSPTSPRVLDNNGLLLHDIPVKTGWNWISFNLGFPDPAISTVLNNFPNASGDLIKDQIKFSTNTNNIWSGSLTSISHKSLYMYQAAQPKTIKITGNALTPPSESIVIVSGWNWIGYIPSYKLPVNAALVNINSTTGDVIKSQSAFAQYVNSTVKWVGNLTHLEAPNGYLLRSANAAVLKYPVQSLTDSDPPPTRSEKSTLWNVDATLYEHSMTLIGAFEYAETNATTAGMELGAFVGDELRGAGEAIYVEHLDSYMFFLTCFANTSGEQLHFKLYDATTGEVQLLKEKMTFIPHQHQGSIEIPVPFSLKTTGIGDVYSELSFNVQPNPFRDETVCRIELPDAQLVHLIITDTEGKQLYYTQLQANAGMNLLTWKGCSTSGTPLSNGIYFIRLETEQGVLTKKVMLQR